jgi:hypothetical protein
VFSVTNQTNKEKEMKGEGVKKDTKKAPTKSLKEKREAKKAKKGK